MSYIDHSFSPLLHKNFIDKIIEKKIQNFLMQDSIFFISQICQKIIHNNLRGLKTNYKELSDQTVFIFTLNILLRYFKYIAF